MLRLVLAIAAFFLALAVIKAVIVALIIAGLIFRTKETIGLLLILGLFALIAAHPVLGLAATAGVITIGVIYKNREDKSALPIEDPDQE